jgi:hypothetical protein
MMEEILSKVQRADITITEAIEQINELLPGKPKGKRGRPKKAKVPPKKNGRPRRLSTYQKRIAIMTAIVVLDVEKVPLSKMEQRKKLSDLFCVSEKKIDAIITELNKRANNGEVDFCKETREVRFLPKQQMKEAEILGSELNVKLRRFELSEYDKANPKKAPIK